MEKDFLHPQIGEEITAIGGSYWFVKEGRLTLLNRDLLYLIAIAVVDRSCCGTSGVQYALVPGFIVDYHHQTDEEGRLYTSVEPLKHPALRNQATQHIQRKEGLQQVQFLP